MLSLINFTAYKCADRDTCLEPINAKARMCSEPLPWVDMAIGIILCIIGGLGQYLMIPAPIAQILLDVGGAQIGLGALAFMARPCSDPCAKAYNYCRQNWPDAKAAIFNIFCCCLKTN